MTGYVLRQAIDMLATPMVVAAMVAAVGGILWARGRQRAAGRLFIGAAAVVYIASLLPVGDMLLGHLERQYPPLSESDLPKVGYVVVLGASYWPRPAATVAAALGEEGLARIVEGVRIARRNGTARLVVSGGAPGGRAPPALGYAQMARELGIDNGSIVVLGESLNTGAEARSIAALTNGEPFLLVTSAYHMPRAVRLMERVNARPIPAPTDQQTGAAYAHYWNYFLPASAGLRRTERAIHEYLGLAASAVNSD
jgi:uncharacterized SAM-binding protein YcdF (DUF218 family)